MPLATQQATWRRITPELKHDVACVPEGREITQNRGVHVDTWGKMDKRLYSYLEG
jgi:hypothetical protein